LQIANQISSSPLGAFASVIVVNFNGRRFLGDCLASLERQSLPRYAFEVLVIDNGSTDSSVPFIRERFPWVRLVALNRNTGFTGANNLGFRLARGRYVILLNNDTRVAANWLEELIRAAAPPQIGGVAARIVYRSDPRVLNSTGLRLLPDGRGADRDRDRLDAHTPRPAGEVFGGCGASLLLKREIIEDLGGFDAALFMYYEDLDLAWRGRLRGWQFAYGPAALVEHVCGGTSDFASPFVLRHIERNRALVNLRNAPAFLALWSVAGLLLRAGRAFGRWLQSPRESGLTVAHLRGMTWAVASVLRTLPARLLARYETRIAARRRADRDVLGSVFSRS
jgi:GT2 family glycosyltransferase